VPTAPRTKSARPGPVRRRRNERKATVVLLVRHGLTPTTGKVLPGQAPGLHLSERGRAQAEGAAGRIAELSPKPAAVYASPMERARETAAPIARGCGLRVRTHSGLLDCAVGEWEGKSLRLLARKPEWRTVVGWPTGFRFPGGESFAEMQARVLSTVLDLARAHEGERIVCVSHADPIQALIGSMAGMPFDMFQRIMVSPASISAVLVGPGRPTVLCVNTTGSLGELVPS